ncbi:hypothetical protein BOTNAR_0425g00050 [Botryotinia narcissicola]|uniref:Repressor of RNA polymerase III transcription MAF1 n=1 Tax=Botryotinia narcissicola TaxID=278944 RepID=A0A4Z1HLQ9_9HELO|nr:hypothetical protein BOTNAR_0425g00050 [Botryotinia narcissicola]
MKFLTLRDFDNITSALNFNTPDCHVIGGCDLYTTKAAGSDKKLYKNIENSLKSQYESLLKLSASVSPPLDPTEAGVNLSRSSPFGPLSQVSSRRTFAYLIATLNASHPDYDFSHNLRPADFHKERSLKTGMTLHVPSQTSYKTTSSAGATSQAWCPQMWALIDKEMTLKDCTVYSWAPPDEPFDGELGSIWSLNYFFFNKEKKRVAYFYVRAVPVMSHSPSQGQGIAGREAEYNDAGANKRARYWLGDRADNLMIDQDGDDDTDVNMWNEDDQVDPEEEYYDDYDDEADDEFDDQNYKAPIRGVSEDMAASMDIDC